MARYKKITKKKRVDAPDEFISFWDRAFTWFNNNRNKVVLPLIGIFIAGLVVGGAIFYSRQKEFVASTELAFILDKFPRPGAKSTIEGDAEKLGKLEKILKEFSSRNSGIGTGRVGELYMAHVAFINKDMDGAAKAYRQISAKNQGNLLAQLATIGLATAQEEDGKYSDAIETLRKLRNDRENPFLEITDLAIARNYELNGDNTSAINEYEYFLREYPSSPLKAEVEEKLAHLQ